MRNIDFTVDDQRDTSTHATLPPSLEAWAPKAVVDEDTLVRALLGALLLTAG